MIWRNVTQGWAPQRAGGLEPSLCGCPHPAFSTQEGLCPVQTFLPLENPRWGSGLAPSRPLESTSLGVVPWECVPGRGPWLSSARRYASGAECRSDADNTGMISASSALTEATSLSPKGFREACIYHEVQRRKEHVAFFPAEQQSVG